MDAFLLAAGHVASSSVPRGGLGRQIKFTLPVDEEKSGMVQLRQILLGYSRSRLHLYSCHRRWQSSSPRASMKDMEELVRSGEIQTIAPKDAKPLLSVETSPYKLLDVRPMWEREKAWVDGSLHVPLFIEDVDTSPVTLLKKWISMGFAGMWLGQRLTAPNEDFVEQIEEALPSKEQKIMVACGEGLRSMLAIEELRNAGYTQLAWVAGGFSNVRDGDFVTVERGSKLQWASIGGVSEYLLRFTVLMIGLVNTVAGTTPTKENEL